MVTAIIERLAVLSGVGLIVYGVSLIYAPAAIILAGMFLLAGTFWRART